MADVNTLKDRLTRLDNLPTIINWRGTWVPDVQYFLNDVVVSPATFSTYILYSQTTIFGGGDPSINTAAWVAIGAMGNGVTGVRGGVGIGIANGNVTPVISNTGVINVGLVINGGVSNGGDAQNPILFTTDVQDITATEPSIGVNQPTPNNYVITNLGVVDAIGGTNNGLSVSKDAAFNLNVANTGVVTLAAGDGITIDYPVDPHIPNVSLVGLLSVVGGTGITTTDLNHEAEILNDGVTGINAGYGMYVNGGPTTTLRSKTSKLTRIWSLSTVTGPLPNPIASPKTSPPTPGQTALYSFTPITGNIFADYMANGPPDPAGFGSFLIDMSAFSMSWTNANYLLGRRIIMNFVDTITPGGPYYSNTLTIQATVGGLNSPASVSLGRLALNIAFSRKNGMRLVNGFTILNSSGAYQLSLTSIGDGWATYYPQTLVSPT